MDKSDLKHVKKWMIIYGVITLIFKISKYVFGLWSIVNLVMVFAVGQDWKSWAPIVFVFSYLMEHAYGKAGAEMLSISERLEEDQKREERVAEAERTSRTYGFRHRLDKAIVNARKRQENDGL